MTSFKGYYVDARVFESARNASLDAASDIRRWALLAGALLGALALPSQKTMCLRQKAKRCLSATWLNEHLSKGEDEVQELRHRGCHAT